MKKYISIFRIRFINSLQYRIVVIGAIMKGFILGIMEILVYVALYHTNNTAFPMNFSQIVSYVWIQQVLMVLFLVVFGDGEIYSAIANGTIAYDLVRPIDLYGRWFFQSVANRFSFTVVNCMPVLLLALIVPKPYRLTFPLSIEQLFMFILSALLAFMVVVAFALLMYISLFYIISQRGVRIIVTAISSFLSGGVIPLPFFPDKVLTVVNFLPFAAMQNMPLQIFCGNITGIYAVKGIIFQMFWLIALVVIGKLSMGQALKNVIVQGG